MKLYETKENTPLSFYKFYRNICIPLGFASFIYSITREIILTDFVWYTNWYTLTLRITGIFLAVADVIVFIGLIKWKRYAFTLIVIEFIAKLIAYCCNFINAGQQPYMLTITIVMFVISIVLNVLILVYFYKRQLLLDGVPYTITSPVHKLRRIY